MNHAGAMPPRRERGFTLLEVLISVTICTALTTLCVVTYHRVTLLIHRAQWRHVNHDHAQSLYASLSRSVAVLEQHCALVLMSHAATPGLPPVPGAACPLATGAVSMIFMHGKEDNDDWNWLSQGDRRNTDLVWETWVWNQAGQTLSVGSSSPRRTFQIQGSFVPVPGGPDYYGTTFTYLPQPRRVLDPVHPLWTLNDTMLFPVDPVQSATSRAGAGDYGDAQDLTNNLAVVLTHVSELTIQLVNADGSLSTADGSTEMTLVHQGVWMDGRIGPTLATPATPAAFAASDIALRPRLIRLRYVVSDPASRRAETFSFTLSAPACEGPP